MSYLARLSYNSSGWRQPTAEAGKLEATDTFNNLNSFGFEDWFFRGEWQIDGWRYAFLQQANLKGNKYLSRPINVSLYTIQPDKQRRWVADVHDLERLSTTQSEEAQAFFQRQGWLAQMQHEVGAVGGDPKTILNTTYAGYFLNVRYRVENLQLLPPDTRCPAFFWKGTAAYYNFYEITEDLDNDAVAGVPVAAINGRQDPLPEGPIYRQGVGATQFTPEHRKMQARLLEILQLQYGRERVWIEVNGIDAMVVTDTETRLYEIKTDQSPLTVIRQALGQILEYAYHPQRKHAGTLSLTIVGPQPLDTEAKTYLKHLTQNFGLPLNYQTVNLDG